MLAGIERYRREVSRIVRRERRAQRTDGTPIKAGLVDVDVSAFGLDDEDATGVDSDEHRRLACDAKAELWRNIRAGELHPDDQVQTFEEMSHTA